MTKDEIVSMANKAIIGHPDCDPEDIPQLKGDELAVFERFAALVAEKEREACEHAAVVAISLCDDPVAAIQARGQK
jgi:hypothetical protein